VVLLVLLAIYSKMQDEEAPPLFQMEDAYLIVGAFLGFVVLRFAFGSKQKGRDQGKKDK